MNLSRNLTIFLSCCFASISWQAKPGFAAEPSAPASETQQPETVASLFHSAQTFAAAKKFDKAEKDLVKAHAIEPNNRDVVYFLARIMAWQGRHEDARNSLLAWPADDRESFEIHGDLAWYRGDFSEAAKYYHSAIDDDSPASSWALWIKALNAAGQKKQAIAAQKVAHEKFPEDTQFVEAKKEPATPPTPPPPPKKKSITKKKPVPPSTDIRASLNATDIFESQNQTARAYDADIAVINSRKSLGLGATTVTRDYGPTKLTDTPLRMTLGIGFRHSDKDWVTAQETTLILGGSPKPKFTSAKYFRLHHDFYLGSKWILYGEVGAIWYTELFVRVLSGGGIYTSNSFRYEGRGSLTKANQSDLAGFASIDYLGFFQSHLSAGFYIYGGRDAASRPYILREEDAAFQIVGLRSTWSITPRWGLRGSIEERWEVGFFQRSASLALLWNEKI